MDQIIQFVKTILMLPVYLVFMFIMVIGNDKPLKWESAPKPKYTEQQKIDWKYRNPESVAECDEIINKGFDGDNCFYEYSLNNSSSETCKRIINNNLKSACINDIKNPLKP